MKPIKFYEVVNKGEALWGGASAKEAIEWFRRGVDNSIYVSVWDEENEDDFKLITDKIDVTNLVLATMVEEGERWLERVRG